MLERRRRRRFPVHQPVLLKRQEETGGSAVRGVSENASETGVLFLATGKVPLGVTAEVRVSMPNGIQLCALGTVVRAMPDKDKKLAVAVECMHGFSETTSSAWQNPAALKTL